MKHLLLNLTLLSLLTACQTGEPEKDYSADIESIENGLLPALILEGEEIPAMSIENRMAHYKVPGLSIAFFENGAIQWRRTYGYLSNDSLQRVNENTRFQAASISKPVAATGMLTLIQKGVLDLDTDVNSYLQEWKIPENGFTREEKVTLRRLVTHNAGLTVHGFRGYASDEAVPTTVQVLNGEDPANSDPILPDTFPGAIWRYSGGGYTVMQRVIEETTGKTFPAFMQEAVLSPAGMKRSTYEHLPPTDNPDNIAIGHRSNGEKVSGNWHTYPEMAAAGLWTTPSDLATWAIAIQNAYNGSENGILSPETAKKMLTKHQNEWGLGPGLSGEDDSLSFGHGGANEGYRCNLFAFAKKGGQGVAIMTNGDRGASLYMEILRSISNMYDWNRFEPAIKTVISLSAEEKAAYTGLYQVNEQLKVRLDLEGETLKGTPFWDQPEFVLLPEAEDRFFDRSDGTTLTFFRGEDGKVAGFEAEGYRFVKMKNVQ
jgi:CubicO group peptidase (beta-lactamase class C family)